jgi:hypothetical protein
MKNHIDITDTTETRTVDVLADCDVEVADAPIDFAEMIQGFLEKCKGKKELPEGKYTIRLLCVVTQNGDT